MEDFRQNKVSLIIGGRGHGKTDYLRGNAAHNLPGFFPVYLNRGQKIVIVDTLDHPSYRDIEILAQKDFFKWKSGIKRIIIDPEEINDFCGFMNHRNNLHSWNTFFVFEDATKHTEGTVSKNLKRLILDSKQKNMDIVLMYHSFAQAPPKLYRMINLIELFKTLDHPQCRKTEMPGYYEEALRIYNEVQNHPFKYHHQLIDTGL